MRRWRPRAHGRATRVAKGMSHITVVLQSSEET
jgi:large subunit ribosomal protein L22